MNQLMGFQKETHETHSYSVHGILGVIVLIFYFILFSVRFGSYSAVCVLKRECDGKRVNSFYNEFCSNTVRLVSAH